MAVACTADLALARSERCLQAINKASAISIPAISRSNTSLSLQLLLFSSRLPSIPSKCHLAAFSERVHLRRVTAPPTRIEDTPSSSPTSVVLLHGNSIHTTPASGLFCNDEQKSTSGQRAQCGQFALPQCYRQWEADAGSGWRPARSGVRSATSEEANHRDI